MGIMEAIKEKEIKDSKKNEPIAKTRLKAYIKLRREIDNKCERLERMEASLTSTSGGIGDGMPHASFVTDRMAEKVCKKLELEEMIKEDIKREKKELKALENLVEQLEDPDERQVICLKYFDSMGWPDVCEALYYRNEDYDDCLESYQRRTYRVHGNALQNLSRLMEPKSESKTK